MSYTVVVTEEVRARRTENRINAVFRHCRIGKVKAKGTEIGPAPAIGYPSSPFEGLPPYDWHKQRYLPDLKLQWMQNPVVSTCAAGHTH